MTGTDRNTLAPCNVWIEWRPYADDCTERRAPYALLVRGVVYGWWTRRHLAERARSAILDAAPDQPAPATVNPFDAALDRQNAWERAVAAFEAGDGSAYHALRAKDRRCAPAPTTHDDPILDALQSLDEHGYAVVINAAPTAVDTGTAHGPSLAETWARMTDHPTPAAIIDAAAHSAGHELTTRQACALFA